MRIIAVNHVNEPSRLAEIPEEWETWTTDEPIDVTYARITRTAIEEEWGLETILIQDDVRGDLPEATQFTVYGTRRKPGHVCPHAFTADLATWLALAEVWGKPSGSLCPRWYPLIRQRGTVLNSVTHLGEEKPSQTDRRFA